MSAECTQSEQRPAVAVHRLVGRYDVAHIAKTLRKMGEGGHGYHGNELHSAKDLVLDYPEQRGAVLRYLVGRERTGDHILLQEAGMILQGVYSPNVRGQMPRLLLAEPMRTHRMCQKSRRDGGYLDRSVRLLHLLFLIWLNIEKYILDDVLNVNEANSSVHSITNSQINPCGGGGELRMKVMIALTNNKIHRMPIPDAPAT